MMPRRGLLLALACTLPVCGVRVSNITQQAGYTALAPAIAAAQAGDVLRLSTGVFAESVVITAQRLAIAGGFSGDCREFVGGSTRITRAHCAAATVVWSHVEFAGATNTGLVIDQQAVVSCAWVRACDNTGDYGGGVRVSDEGTRAQFANCIFSQNVARVMGGGALVTEDAQASFDTCIFAANLAANQGGGLAVYWADCTVGAALTNPVPTPPNQFIDNRVPAGDGGGAYFDGSGYRMALANALLAGNAATLGGAVVAIAGMALPCVNCVIVSNAAVVGAGIATLGFAHVQGTQCTIADNAGDGIAVTGNDHPGEVTLTNCIVWQNVISNYSLAEDTRVLHIAYSDVQGGWPGPANFSADPRFVDAATRQYALLPDSPCTNRGVALPIVAPQDCIGVPRPQAGGWDLGAYEAVPEPGLLAAAMLGLALTCTARHTHQYVNHYPWQ
jgi:hypothetical protein